MLASNEPNTVPQSATDTVIPRPLGESWNAVVSSAVAPAMTAVSNPNSKPPRAATTVLFTSVVFSAMHYPPLEAPRCERLDCDKYVRPKPMNPGLQHDCRVPEAPRKYQFPRAARTR